MPRPWNLARRYSNPHPEPEPEPAPAAEWTEPEPEPEPPEPEPAAAWTEPEPPEPEPEPEPTVVWTQPEPPEPESVWLAAPPQPEPEPEFDPTLEPATSWLPAPLHTPPPEPVEPPELGPEPEQEHEELHAPPDRRRKLPRWSRALRARAEPSSALPEWASAQELPDPAPPPALVPAPVPEIERQSIEAAAANATEAETANGADPAVLATHSQIAAEPQTAPQIAAEPQTAPQIAAEPQPAPNTVPTPDPEPTPGFVERGRIRRRARYLRRLREVQLRDIGGFVVELHRFGRDRPDLVALKVESAERTGAELRALERALGPGSSIRELREAGIGGACDTCGAVHGSEDRYCASCGEPLQPELYAADEAGEPGTGGVG